ncbi:hypothetical protein Stsp01_66290 [Streptomyces sp. NBRC 13847]|nr:hypothetical protein Stsp01_66290 [Streptomyces sp. NBRC 13847]
MAFAPQRDCIGVGFGAKSIDKTVPSSNDDSYTCRIPYLSIVINGAPLDLSCTGL